MKGKAMMCCQANSAAFYDVISEHDKEQLNLMVERVEFKSVGDMFLICIEWHKIYLKAQYTYTDIMKKVPSS